MNITVSQELAQKLFDNGYPQEDSTFYWTQDQYTKEWHLTVKDMPQINFDSGYLDLGDPTDAWWIKGFNDEWAENVISYIAAPTAEEVGEKFLLQKIDIWTYHNAGKYILDSTGLAFNIDGDTEAEIRAKFWLYLKEKGLI